jgi:hypothetical protein
MVNHRLIFRVLVASSAILYAVLYLLPFDSFESDPDRIRLLKWDAYGALIKAQSWYVTAGVFGLWLVAYVELLRLQSWARYLYLALTIWGLVAAGLYGVRVISPTQAVLDLAGNLLDGAILAMAYFSTLRTQFK